MVRFSHYNVSHYNATEGAVGNSTLHGTIPKILNSALLTNKYTKVNEDQIFLDLKKQQGSLDTYVLKPTQSLLNTPNTIPTLIL